MSRFTKTVENSIDNVSNISNALGKGSAEITSGMNVIEISLSNVSNPGDQMNEISENLNSEVLKFKTEISDIL